MIYHYMKRLKVTNFYCCQNIMLSFTFNKIIKSVLEIFKTANYLEWNNSDKFKLNYYTV